MEDRECATCSRPLKDSQKRFCSKDCQSVWFKDNEGRRRKQDSWQVYDYSNFDPEDALYGDV